MQAIWDGASETYTDNTYSDIADSIVKDLRADGTFCKDVSVMDIGCGPGTYAFRISPHVRKMVCIDGSQRMIDRLMREAAERNISNIETLVCDCRLLPGDLVCDVVFTSLCPPMNYPEMILEMEKHADRKCAYVSSSNVGTSIELEIWDELGCDYSYTGYNTNYPNDFLRSLGRKTQLRFYEQGYEETISVEKCIDRFLGKFSKYRTVTEKERDAITKVVRSHDEDGLVHISSKNRFGLLTWMPE